MLVAIEFQITASNRNAQKNREFPVSMGLNTYFVFAVFVSIKINCFRTTISRVYFDVSRMQQNQNGIECEKQAEKRRFLIFRN